METCAEEDEYPTEYPCREPPDGARRWDEAAKITSEQRAELPAGTVSASGSPRYRAKL